MTTQEWHDTFYGMWLLFPYTIPLFVVVGGIIGINKLLKK